MAFLIETTNEHGLQMIAPGLFAMSNGTHDTHFKACTMLNRPILERLRNATQASHARLDGAFGALDLARAGDCRRFLRAHAGALANLHPHFARFVREELDMPCPDFPAMLEADLAERDGLEGIVAIEPADAMLSPGAAPGLAYVVAGSRLGNMVIRQQGYFGRAMGMPSRYMEDDTGHAVWKALGTWTRARAFGDAEADAIEAAALATFAHFETAFNANAAGAETANRELPQSNG